MKKFLEALDDWFAWNVILFRQDFADLDSIQVVFIKVHCIPPSKEDSNSTHLIMRLQENQPKIRKEETI